MAKIHDQIRNALRTADTFICLSDAFGVSLVQLGEPLIDSIEDNGQVPYFIEDRSRYRSSPQASCLYCLWSANLLPPEAARLMRKGLFDLRDNMASFDQRPPREKDPKDVDAWCVSEGASVWSTSMALIALLHSRFEQKKMQDRALLQATSWLLDQQNKERGGWAFQKTLNSRPTVPLTSLALRALAKASAALDLPNQIHDRIESSLHLGFTYLLSKAVRERTLAYWTFGGKPSLTATVWSLQALKDGGRLLREHDFLSKALRFSLHQLPESDCEWPSERFLTEPVTKYAHQKNFYTFMPSLIAPLLELGLSPFEERVVDATRNLLHHGRDKWRIKEYHMKPCTFTHAMALHALVSWCTHAQIQMTSNFLGKRVVKGKHANTCPVYPRNPNYCIANKKVVVLRIMLIAAISLLVLVALLVSDIRSALTAIALASFNIFANPWVVTIVGGIVASAIFVFLRRRVQGKFS